MAKIQYNAENCMKCLCPGCPVQTQSKCTATKKPKWQKMRQEMGEMMPEGSPEARGGMSMPMGKEIEMEMLEPEEMIGLYCSYQVGKSTCHDLDASQQCTCPSCEVWISDNLQSQHYCTEGDADLRS